MRKQGNEFTNNNLRNRKCIVNRDTFPSKERSKKIGSGEKKIRMENKKRVRIRVCNLVAVGKLPFKRNLKITEINKIIDDGKFSWNLIHQDSAPQLIVRKELEELNSRKKKRKIIFSIWHSGKFHSSGAKNRKEIKEFYLEIVKEITKLCPRVFHE